MPLKKIFKTILLVLNFVALLLMLGSTLAGVVVPSKFIVFSLLSYGYLYLVLLNVAFVVIWLMLSSKWFLLSLAGILVRMSFIPLYFQVGGSNNVEVPEDSVSQYLKVMTFNVHSFSGAELKRDVDVQNMLDFIKIVEDEQPDVLALQEYAGRRDTLNLTNRLMQMGYIHKTSGREDATIWGNVVFSKVPIVFVDRIGESTKMYADILWGEDTLRLYCLHLNSYHLDESDQKQIHDISHGNVDSTTGRGTLRKFRNTILEHENEWNTLELYFESRESMTIVAGDFNDTPASFFYQHCRKYFVDSYCEAGGGFSTTYHGAFTRRASFPAFRIDMLLHTSDMKAVAYHRIKSEISDHYPVVVTLKK